MPTLVPPIQFSENSGDVLLFWEARTDPAVESFNLYWSYSDDTSAIPDPSNPARHLFPKYHLVKKGIPNYPTMGKRNTSVTFSRKSIGVADSDSFYVAISPVIGSDEGYLGDPRFIAYQSDQPTTAGSLHSPITGSQRFQRLVGPAPVRQMFSCDIKQLEIFNFSKDKIIFLDMTGLDADASSSMPIMPYGYYAIGRNLSKDTGVSLVSPEGTSDVRIVAHY